MIPILYESTETAFTSNGLGRLRDTISAVVTEEKNGVYELDFQYPVDGANFDLIQIGRIVGVSHSEETSIREVSLRGPIEDENDVNLTDENGEALTGPYTKYIPEYDIQPFDIVSFSRPIDGVVSFHCQHISYRQSYLTVTGSNINTLSDALALLSNAEPNNPFTYQTDFTASGYMAAADGKPKTVRSLLGGEEGSILNVYGGEYEWDKFNVILHSSRGTTRDFSIRYGVNMLDYNEELDSTGTYSSCVPYWTDGTTTIVGDRQDSSGSTVTGRGECVPLDVSDKFESQPTKEKVEAMGLSVMNANNPMIPTQNIHVEFVRLQDMGYEGFENLYDCKLCDKIKVIFPFYHTTGEFQIVKTVWDVLADRYESMELGDLSVTLAEALGISSASSRTSDMTDFVVETGTSNGWTYRKWNNGVSECWGGFSVASKTYAAHGGAVMNPSNMPSGLFVDTSKMVINANARITGVGLSSTGFVAVNNTTNIQVWVLNTGSSAVTNTAYVQVHIIGTWK